MTKKYIMQRISHETNVSHRLFNIGYISIGFNKANDVFEAAITGDWRKYDTACNSVYVGENWWNSTLKRNQLFRFLTLSVGDIIVIPLWNRLFSICEVIGKPISISDFDLSILGDNKGHLSIRDGILYDGDREVDLGFVIPVKPVKEPLLRSEYADAKLTSRMKVPQTNVDIDDIAESVEHAICAKTPINFYDKAVESISVQFLKTIKSDLNPRKFEKLIRWFMEKQGFNAYILPTNEPGKIDGADADVVASSELLQLVIYIQGKFHEGTSSDWAVEQIARYSEQKDLDDDYIYIQWVVSSADDFSKEAKEKAIEKGVRLIDGLTFARMLIDAGVDSINDAFE